MDKKIALLIDADNISGRYVDILFKQAASYGDIIVRKAYGRLHEYTTTAKRVVGLFVWEKETVLKYAIEPVARYAAVGGKNTADTALVIDALNLMHKKIVSAICIASNDSDFSLLAMELRENGIKVYGFGTKNAQKYLVSSCDEFFYLDIIDGDDTADDDTDTSKKYNLDDDVEDSDSKKNDSIGTGKKYDLDDGIEDGASAENDDVKVDDSIELEDIRNIIINACDLLHDDEGWAFLANVGQYIKRIYPSFSPKEYGYYNLRNLVEGLDMFEVEHDKVRLEVRIRKK